MSATPLLMNGGKIFADPPPTQTLDPRKRKRPPTDHPSETGAGKRPYVHPIPKSKEQNENLIKRNGSKMIPEMPLSPVFQVRLFNEVANVFIFNLTTMAACIIYNQRTIPAQI